MAEINSIDELFMVTKKKLEGEKGKITIDFAGKSHVYSGNDVIGNCLQEWLPEWFKHLNVDIQDGPNSQAFPDFIARFGDKKYDVEVKAWNVNNAPAFDLANYYSFIDTTFDDPRKIDAKYFVLAYEPVNDGFSEGFVIKNVYMKNIWEITSHTRSRPIGIQMKRNAPYAIRPYNFHRRPGESFGSRADFVEAIRETIVAYPPADQNYTADEWKMRVDK